MPCINLLNSRGGTRSLDFVITTYSYPLSLAKKTLTSPWRHRTALGFVVSSKFVYLILKTMDGLEEKLEFEEL